MSSAFRAPSQVRPHAYYRVNTAFKLRDEEGAQMGSNMTAGAVLADMGKTIVLANGDILRKVKLMDGETSGLHEGYIYLLRAAGIADDASAL